MEAADGKPKLEEEPVEVVVSWPRVAASVRPWRDEGSDLKRSSTEARGGAAGGVRGAPGQKG